ncbi:alpha-(1-_3)-arabinofuranosyltransferase domain-containing protein [Haloechinothrix halophila]|uniref:alpha-(1->3)-arabinofuranosyltransferase domain-containing protein n=1 Tax=Haloechinothrix halophila TaxID=1069073 RepID=UPI000688AA1E|nr:alpha-(1->3)-arabinofuranosyltransferase family protein [Haloechinothrix halophila]
MSVTRVWRTPTAWVMVALTVLSFLQLPGRTTFDTKLDLVVNPIDFLGRSLHLWNPEASGGELQNQAYGYLFPMGPFFATGDILGIPPWITQRLWCALLLCLAFLGALALARALRIGSEPARYAGALGYALAPRMLTEIGPISAEMLPAVMLPWAMLPLVTADRIGSPRKAAALSALAVLGMGGVNGAAVVMALVLPGLWLLTRRWTREHVRLVAWWAGSVTLASLWWLLPLLLLGQYSLPFIDYVESSANTTSPTSLLQVLRGTNQWVAYVYEGTAWWPSGYFLVDNPVLMLATALLAMVALFGLLRPGLPERPFLILGVFAGVTLLTIGYVGTLDSPFAETVRDLLDGPLAPLRNVHKFEPGLRLPLMLAFAHAISGVLPGMARGLSRGTAAWTVVWARRARLGVGFLLVAIVATPAWTGTLRPGPGWQEIPDYWGAAMGWLGEHSEGTRTLLVPGTGFGEYEWGKTVDEPVQPLAASSWAMRSQIPLGSEGNTRLMEAVENALANGRGSDGLAAFLARGGHGFLLLRNDIDRETTSAPPLTVLRAALTRSDGIERVTGFGPELRPSELPIVSGIDLDAAPARAIEIYRVKRPVPTATAVRLDDVATVSGGPESVLRLLDTGLLRQREPTILAGDADGLRTGRWLATDGLRHRERNVGRVRANLSQTMTVDEQPRQDRPALDLLPVSGLSHKTLADYQGIRSVTASSAVSYADAVRVSDPSGQPFAAIDGNAYTTWQSSSFYGPQGQWLNVELDTPRQVEEVTLRLVNDRRVGWPVTRVRITTDAGSVEHELSNGGTEARLPVASGLTGSVRVTILDVAANRQTGNVGIAELDIPGVTAQRALRVPGDVDPAEGQPLAFSFSRGSLPRYACVTGHAGQRCDSGLTRFGEEPHGLHRLLRTPVTTRYEFGGTVLPAFGGDHPVSLPGVELSSSTTLAGDPAAGPLAAVDGNPATTWIADVTDTRPTLRLRWQGQRKLTGLRLRTDETSGAARPAEVVLSTPFTNRTVELDEQGHAPIDLVTDQLDVHLVAPAPQPNDAGITWPAGTTGITELSLDGAGDLLGEVGPDTPFTVPCGSGPPVTVDGFQYATSVSGTVGDVNDHRELRLGTCEDSEGGIELGPGSHEVHGGESASFVVQDLWLRPVRSSGPGESGAGGAAAASASPDGPVVTRAVTVRQWDIGHRKLDVAAGESAVLTVPENANDGWVATVDGEPLRRTRVDGWQQAWLLPAGDATTVTLTFEPDTRYRQALLIGGLAALGLLIVLLVPARRRSLISTVPGGARVITVALGVLLVVVGGVPAVIALLACLLAATLWEPAPRVLAVAGVVTAALTAVTGRLLGNGQEWAYGWLAQGAMLVALAAVAAACVERYLPPPLGSADRSHDVEPGDAEPPAPSGS